jgi:uncharacterized membrane protein YdjX (TVP38/TMEM64 family)
MTSGARRARWHLQEGHLWRRVAETAVAITALVLLATSDAMHGALLALFHAADQAIETHPVAGPVAFVVFSAASAMLAFVSSALLVPAALVAWGRLETFALLWVGWTVGGAVSYALARYLGRPAVARLAGGTPLARWEKRLSQNAPWRLVVLFQLAVPSEVPGYVLGLLRYPFWRYIAVVVLGELPYALGTVYLGESFLARRPLTLIGLGLLAIAASVLAYRALHARLPAAPPGGD